MKIAFLADARSVHIQRWICFFNRQKDQTFLISLEEPNQTVTETIHIKSGPSWNLAKYLLAISKVKKIIKKINPDILNAHFVPNYGLLGANMKLRPLVISVWGSDILVSAKKSILHKKRASWVLKKADWLTSDSFYLTDQMVKLGIDQSKISTLPMGVEEDIFPPVSKKLLARNTLTVLSTRRLEPIYNLDLLIQAIPLVFRKTKEKVRFVILGEGSQKKRLQEQIRTLDWAGSVEFKGHLTREELVKLLLSSDIYVSSSLSDSTSVSLLEALACGLVPIVTDIPGNREWIKDKLNGFLVPLEQPRVLAEKISYVCENFANLQSIVDKNAQIVKEKADYQANLTRLRDKFQELVQISKSG